MNYAYSHSGEPYPERNLVSIIIVNWNTRQLLQECLESISATLTESLWLQTEIIVVDNGSDDGTVEMIRDKYDSVRLIINHDNLGYAKANNQGIKASTGRYLLLLNSDARLVPEALDEMISCLDTDDKAGIVGICLVYPNGLPQFCCDSFPTLWREFKPLFSLHRWDLSYWNKDDGPFEVDWVSGACLMIRKEMLEEIGCLDDSFFMFGEEVDLCRRATLGGWKVLLVTSPSVIHIEAGSETNRAIRFVTLYQGKLNYAGKHWGRYQAEILLLMMKLSILLKCCVSIAGSVFSDKMAQNRIIWSRVFRAVILNSELTIPAR